jgi:hypothetical protein
MFKRRAPADSGFLLSFLINLALRPEWLALALILFILHKVFGWPAYFALLALAAWVLVSFGITLVLSLVCRGDSPTLNTPGSQTTSERLRKRQLEAERQEEEER